MKHLYYRKICEQLVPYQLKKEQESNRMAASLCHLQRYHEEEYAVQTRIVTRDETWCHHFEPESKRQYQQWKQILPHRTCPKQYTHVPGTEFGAVKASIGIYTVICLQPFIPSPPLHDILAALCTSTAADEPREFNLPTLPQRRITYVTEKLPGKYGVHSEEYLPIRTTYKEPKWVYRLRSGNRYNEKLRHPVRTCLSKQRVYLMEMDEEEEEEEDDDDDDDDEEVEGDPVPALNLLPHQGAASFNVPVRRRNHN
ncbi:hypothetical protein ANN_15480 [Periplaneta americana]|uniref:Uncharacterized protein n=1 Tax=Periplaneta americana TaxID=6978 RepID=A0ABQ8SHU1_PERAM|nr:hypothetical protein ANN_15480 [Periplaneta americana]